MAKYDPYADFRKWPKEEQLDHILNVCSMCIDGAPKSLARQIEIYFDVTDNDQQARRAEFFRRMNKKINHEG